MKVQIKSPEIPEGYTYRRCDAYTPEEFVQACSINYDAGIWSLLPANKMNPHAIAHVKKNPKAEYTTEDVLAVMRKTIR